MIITSFRFVIRNTRRLVWLLMGFMLGVKVARSQTHNHNQSHVSYQEKQHHNSQNIKLEPGTRVDQQQNRRRAVANDSSCLVTLSTRTQDNQLMYQILKNGTLLVNAQDLQTAMVYVRSLESNLDRLTTHSPYTIVKVHQDGTLDMS